MATKVATSQAPATATQKIAAFSRICSTQALSRVWVVMRRVVRLCCGYGGGSHSLKPSCKRGGEGGVGGETLPAQRHPQAQEAVQPSMYWVTLPSAPSGLQHQAARCLHCSRFTLRRVMRMDCPPTMVAEARMDTCCGCGMTTPSGWHLQAAESLRRRGACRILIGCACVHLTRPMIGRRGGGGASAWGAIIASRQRSEWLLIGISTTIGIWTSRVRKRSCARG